MHISNPTLKNLIFDIVFFTDDLDDKGNRVKRQTFNKAHYRGAMEIKKAIHLSTVLLCKPKETTIDPDIKTISLTEVLATPNFNKEYDVISENITNTEVEFGEKALKAVKYYYADREELPEVNLDVLAQLEEMLA